LIDNADQRLSRKLHNWNSFVDQARETRNLVPQKGTAPTRHPAQPKKGSEAILLVG